MAASRVYAGVNIPMVTGASTDPQLTAKGLHDVFRVTYSDTYQGSGAATAAWALGHSRAYVVDDSTAYGNGLANGFATAFSAAGGNVLKHAHTSDTQTKFSSLVTKIVAARPDIVYYGGIFLSGGRLSSQLHVATSTVPVIGGDGLLDPGYIARGGKNGDMCTIAGFPPTALPNGVVFSAAYSAKFPSATMNTYDAYSYDSANVIISALVEQAQTGGTAWLGTRSGKAGTLARISATNMDGATGPISFGPTGERLDPKMSLFKVVSGAWAFQSVY
jgi:branched-chain amino acid transport system substrate-binding protein